MKERNKFSEENENKNFEKRNIYDYYNEIA